MNEAQIDCPGHGSVLANIPASVINAVGYATRVGGSCPSPEVIEAMRWAQERYFEVDDLLDYSSHKIAGITGAEAGIVTCGAAAGLTLGTAAILAGDDIGIMEALPDVSRLQHNVFLYPEPHDYDYDHAVRASGAMLQPFFFASEGLEERLSATFSDKLAGVVYVWNHRADSELVRRISAVCRQAGVPFLLDAAMGLPPAANLGEIISWGPDLAVLSGGKHLGGPQNSGILFGRATLIRSAWLQMADMDVRASSWTQAALIEQQIVPRPPRHGIGRGFKVGKDTIIGCLAALEMYSNRDFAGERERWNRVCKTLADRISSSATLRSNYLSENKTGQYPVVQLAAASPEAMRGLKHQLKSQNPKIILAEDENDDSIAYIYPMCLGQPDVAEIIRRVSHFSRS